METNIRNTRSRRLDLKVEKRDYVKKKPVFPSVNNELDLNTEDTIKLLNNKTVYNEESKAEVLKLMRSIRDFRNEWLTKESPSLTVILEKFKRFTDCEILVS